MAETEDHVIQGDPENPPVDLEAGQLLWDGLLTSENPGQLPDAPRDGQQYARQDGDWEVIKHLGGYGRAGESLGGIPLVACRQMVRDRLGVPAHDEFFSATVLDSNINLALTTLQSEHRWPWNERAEQVLLNQSGELELPFNCRTTRAIITDNRDLAEMTYYDLSVRFKEAHGTPSHYAILNRTLHFRPLPASVIKAQHIYYSEPALLSADLDVPNIPVQYIGVLIAKAAQLCSTREDDRPSAQVHLQEYMQGVDRMRKDIRPTSRPTQIRVRDGSWI